MSNDPTNIILDYMKSLRNSMMFGRCAGKTTRLSKLHQNRLVCQKVRTEARERLYRIANLIIAAHKQGRELRQTESMFLNYSPEVIDFLTNVVVISDVNYEASKLFDNGFTEIFQLIQATLDDTSNANILEQLQEEIHTNAMEYSGTTPVKSKSKPLIWKFHNLTKNSQKLTESLRESESEYQNLTSSLDSYLKTLESKNFRKGSFSGWGARNSVEVEIKDMENKIQQLMLKKEHLRRQLNIENNDVPFWNYLSFLREHKPLFPEGTEIFLDRAINGTISLSKSVGMLQSENGGLVSIFGDPGWGKTIQLRQFAHGFLNDQIQERNIHQFPIYVKAKTLSKHIRNLASSHYGFAVDLPDGGVVNHGGKTTRHVGETNQILIRSMLETESDLNEEEIRNLFDIQRSVAKNMILIVDAYDEVPSQDARFELVNFISDEIENHGWPVIMTCRNSHEEELETVFKQMNNDLNPHYKYKIHFTNEELQFVMPTKLANAWGMNSDQISHTVALEFEAFKNVLTHPLFVGLFCMLKSEGAELSVLDIELNSEDRMSIHHVSFLKQVIKFGLRINIKDRKSISNEDEKVIRKAFLYISAVHLTMGINNLDNILTIMEKLHGFKISQTHRDILAENLGVMFVNGEKEIEWTHKTLPEVAMGMLMVEDSDFLEFLHSTYHGTFGFNGQLWTECLFLTLIEEDLISIHNYTTQSNESKRKLSKEYMPKLVEVFWQEGHDIVLKCLKLLGADQQIFDDASRKIDPTWIKNPEDIDDIGVPDENSWEVIPKPGTPFETELRNRIGNSFFYEQISWECPFPLPIESFGSILENNDENGLLFTFFKTSSVENALIGFQRLDWPKNLSREISLPIDNFSITSLANHYFHSLLSVKRFFPLMERRIFARNLRSFWIDFVDKIDMQNPWHINISESEFLDLILTCCKSDPDMMLLDSFLSGSKYQTDHELERLGGLDYYDDITKFVFEKIDRKGSSQGKLESKWVKDKHPFLFGKLAVLTVEMMLSVHKAKGNNRWEEYISPLKQHWGIPNDFALKVTEGSSKFDKIQSLEIDKIPNTILRYIVGKIE